MVIFGPNSHEKLTKSLIRSNSSRYRTLLRITHLAHRKSYLVIICPNSHEKLTKSEIRSSYYLLQFGFIYLFGPIIPFVSIFSLTYLHLPLFTYIWLYLGFITLIWAYLPLTSLILPYMPYFTLYICIYSIETAPLCKILE